MKQKLIPKGLNGNKFERVNKWKLKEKNIAKSLIRRPTLPNLLSAIGHYMNSTGLMTPPSDVSGVIAETPFVPDVPNVQKLMKVGQIANAIEDGIKTAKPNIVRLYRATGTNGSFEPSIDGGREFAGLWFTTNPRKPQRYASMTVKRARQLGVENPIELLYIDIPESELNKYKASEILKGRKDIEYEPIEDYLIPLDYPRQRIPFEGYTGNYLQDARRRLPILTITEPNDLLQTFLKRAKNKGYNTENIVIVDSPEKMFAAEFGRLPTSSLADLALLIHYLTSALKNGGAYTVNDIIYLDKNILAEKGLNDKLPIPHEMQHILKSPDSPVSQDAFNINVYPEKYIQYYTKKNNNELSARGGQILDYFGIEDLTPLTAKLLQYASENYIKDTQNNNDMTRFFNGIIDFDKMAKWINENAIKYSIPIIMTYDNENEKSKK